jgi:AraC-like DNA-binding protein
MLNFSTSKLPTCGRGREYSKLLSEYYSEIEIEGGVLAEVREDDLLRARSAGFALGDLSCSVHRCNSPMHRYAMRHRSRYAGYSLQMVIEGEIILLSDDVQLHLKAGDLAFIRPLRVLEYNMPSGGSKTIAFHLPSQMANALSLGRRIALDEVFSRSKGIGACVATLMECIAERHGELTPGDCATLQNVMAEAMVQLGTSTHEDPGAQSARAELLETLKSTALGWLHDPGLTPVKVAERAGVSVRTLHRAFQSSGETFWSWVRDRRLERCHLELTTPSLSRRSITEIAFRWGFGDLSTFDRNFRKRYGMAPRRAVKLELTT